MKVIQKTNASENGMEIRMEYDSDTDQTYITLTDENGDIINSHFLAEPPRDSSEIEDPPDELENFVGDPL